MNPVRRSVALGLVAAVALLAGCSLLQQDAGFAVPTGLSPEEAVIALLPYRLERTDDLPGYTLASISAVATPATLRADLTYQPTSEVLLGLPNENGLVVRFSQPLIPARSSGPNSGADGGLAVSLFINPGRARTSAGRLAAVNAALLGPPHYVFRAVRLSKRLGDTGTAAQVTYAPPGQGMLGYYNIRWQRGPLVFALFTAPVPIAQLRLDAAESLAARLDAAEHRRPSLRLAPGRVSPPATEDQRFQPAIDLREFLAVASAHPEGYELAFAGSYPPAGFVAVDPDPAERLRVVDTQWKAVMSAGQDFRSQSEAGLYLTTRATICADSEGAAANLGDFVPVPGWTFASVDPTSDLGDATRAFHEGGTGRDGQPRDDITIRWTHAAVLMQIAMDGPAGTVSMARASVFAQHLEAEFQAHQFSTAGPSGS